MIHKAPFVISTNQNHSTFAVPRLHIVYMSPLFCYSLSLKTSTLGKAPRSVLQGCHSWFGRGRTPLPVNTLLGSWDSWPQSYHMFHTLLRSVHVTQNKSKRNSAWVHSVHVYHHDSDAIQFICLFYNLLFLLPLFLFSLRDLAWMIFMICRHTLILELLYLNITTQMLLHFLIYGALRYPQLLDASLHCYRYQTSVDGARVRTYYPQDGCLDLVSPTASHERWFGNHKLKVDILIFELRSKPRDLI